MAFNLEGIEQFKFQLSRLNEIPNLANEELRQCAEEVAQKARDMAPFEYEDLKKAIQVGRRGSARDARGRFVSGVSNYEVFINLRHPVKDPDAKGVSTVEAYAWEVHEHMGWGSTPGSLYIHGKPFMPNPDRATGPNGEQRGGQFLYRALKELEHGIYARIQRKITGYTQALDN